MYKLKRGVDMFTTEFNYNILIYFNIVEKTIETARKCN